MTTHQIIVKSLQCNGCMSSIESTLLEITGVTAVDIIIAENKLCITGEKIGKEQIITRLASLGYYESGNSNLFSRKNTYDFWYCHCCSSCDSPEAAL